MPPTIHLQLPILGNPHGRIFQKLAPDEDPSKTLLALLRRYGDLIPRKGVVQYYNHENQLHELSYSQVDSGNWVISDPTQVREAL